jgi:hypothetical protein
VTWSADPRPILVAALSGRALAAAARRAGARAIVLDLFADADTAAYAAHCVKLPAGPHGFERIALFEAVARLAPAASGFFYGAGFEHDPVLLAEIARHLPLLGNRPEAVAAVKEPLRFAALLAWLGLPHPETRRAPPAEDRDAWLVKSVGGAGGAHVARAVSAAAAPDTYYQRRVAGTPLSALFLADGRAARLVGFSEQWVAAAEHAPFRYGGCAGPVIPAPRLVERIAEACAALTAATGLVGLNSLDLLVEGERFNVLEINPRPGATLDLFDGAGSRSLWRRHLGAVAGNLPPPDDAPMRRARAAAVVYAPREIVIPRGMVWPRWTADRGVVGSRVDRDAPLCTVRVAAGTAGAARAEAERRAAALLARLGGDRVPQS